MIAGNYLILLFMSLVATAIHYSNWKKPLDDLRGTFEHRSKKASLNKETWKFAQRTYSRNGIFMNLANIALLVLLLAFTRTLPWRWPEIIFGSSLVMLAGMYRMTGWLTERALTAEFDEAGIRRNATVVSAK